MSHGSAERFSLRVTPGVRRARTERLPEAVAFAAFEFINGPLLDNPHRVGRRLLAPLDDRYSARRGSYRIDDKARAVTVVGAGRPSVHEHQGLVAEPVTKEVVDQPAYGSSGSLAWMSRTPIEGITP